MVLEKFRAVRLLEKPEKKPLNKGRKQTQRQTHLQVLQKPHVETQQASPQNLTDEELIRCCVQNSASNLYWGEFYRRFNKLIDKKIIKTLLKFEVICTIDIADELSFSVMEKIHGKQFQKKAVNHPNFPALLNDAILNVVRDWNRKRKRKKNAVRYAIETTMTSLDNVLEQGDGDIRLGETIADPKTNPQYQSYLEILREESEHLFQVAGRLPAIQRLVFRASMMFYKELSDDDIQEVADKRSVKPEEIEKEIDAIMDELVKKNEHYEHQQNMVAIKSAFLVRLGHQLYELEKNPNTSIGKLNEVKKEITDKTKQLENLKRRAQKVEVYPSAAQVAHLLGMPEATQNNLGVWLSRAKEALDKISETVIKNKKYRYDILSNNEKKQ